MPEARIVLGFEDSEVEEAVSRGVQKRAAPAAAPRGAAAEAAATTETFKGFQGAMSNVTGVMVGMAKIAAPAAVLGMIFGQMASVSGPFIGAMARMKIFTMKIAQILGEALGPLLDILTGIFLEFIPVFRVVATIIKWLGTGIKAVVDIMKKFKEIIIGVMTIMLARKAVEAAYIAAGGGLTGAAAAALVAVGAVAGAKLLIDEMLKGGAGKTPGALQWKGVGPTLPGAPAGAPAGARFGMGKWAARAPEDVSVVEEEEEEAKRKAIRTIYDPMGLGSDTDFAKIREDQKADAKRDLKQSELIADLLKRQEIRMYTDNKKITEILEDSAMSLKKIFGAVDKKTPYKWTPVSVSE